MMADQIYKDSIRTPEERAKSLLEEMSLDEKMAQAAGVFPFGEDSLRCDIQLEECQFR